MDFLYALLSHPWGGLVLALFVGVFGWLIVRAAARFARPRIRFAGYTLYVLAGLMAVGGLVTIARVSSLSRAHPPLGQLVDVGGRRMHILAEGEARGRPTLLWIPGGHSAGIGLYGHHRAMRTEARSILFDRPGTGWSDPGPFPRSTARETEELATLLDNAGEAGPFVLVGHSYGGLLAANYARRNPKKTVAVVLLDPTPPDALIYTPESHGDLLRPLVALGQIGGLLASFGIKYDPYTNMAKTNKDVARLLSQYEAVLGKDIWNTARALNVHPADGWASASIFGEFGSERIAESAADLVVYDGELRDLPVYLVTPQESQKDREKAVSKLRQTMKLDDATVQRLVNFHDRVRLRYLATSTRSQHIIAPAGTSHNFPYEQPEFVLNIVRRALTEVVPAQSDQPSAD